MADVHPPVISLTHNPDPVALHRPLVYAALDPRTFPADVAGAVDTRDDNIDLFCVLFYAPNYTNKML